MEAEYELQSALNNLSPDISKIEECLERISKITNMLTLWLGYTTKKEDTNVGDSK